MAELPMPDLSHLSAEERQIIEEVFQRQRAEEEKETQLSQKADQELEAIEKQINQRKEIAQRLVGTQDDAICQICQKTKFADGIGHKCFYCQLRSCARCGGRTASRNKLIWACSLCQQRQRILAKTGKWFQQTAMADEAKGTASPGDNSPTYSASRTSIQSTSRKVSTVSRTNGPYPTAVSPGSTIQTPPTSVTSDTKQSIPVQERSKPIRKPLNSSIKRQTTLLRQTSLETERRNGTAGSATAHMHDNLKQNNDEECSADRSMSVESFEQVAPSDYKLSQQTKSIQYANDRSMQNKSNAEYDYAKNRTKSPEKLRQQSDRSFYDQNRRRVSNGTVDDKQLRDTSFQSNDRYRSQSDVINHDEHIRHGENIREQKGLESDVSPKKNTCSSVVVSVSSGSGAELRRSRTIRENDSKRIITPAIAEQEVHPSPPTTSSVFSAGKRKIRLPRQLYSMSSSEDELPSTSNGNNEEVVPRIDAEISSEKDILRYIYGSQKMRSGRKFPSDSNRKFQRSNEVMNVPMVQSTILPGDMLAAKIRTYLSHPVTWQPSADQHRLIGHMILHKASGAQDLGLKVVGGRRSDTGRLGAFITRVKPGSVADTVGRLREGDEVLEWNGRQLQNATFDQVYDTINLSRNDTQVELIVSRSMSAPGGDDFLDVQRMLPNPAFLPTGGSRIGDYYLSNSLEPSGFSHSQSRTASTYMQPFINVPSNYHPALIRKVTGSPLYDTAGPSKVIVPDDYCGRQFGRGQIFGQIEISLYYGATERQLVVTVRYAIDLPPRSDGAARNPYIKLFLLPDRSEKSRRQSAVLVETCNPIWNEPFYYHGLTKPMLMERVLEVTVWDYDQYETNSFMGEVLIDFAIAQLDDEPFLYTLVDMDEDNPLRAKLQQRRLNTYHASIRPPSEMGHYPNIHQQRACDYTTAYEAYPPGSRQQHMIHSNNEMRRSRTYDRSGARTEEDWTVIYPSGYLSDHGYSNHMPVRYSHRDRRPRSATAMRPLADMRTYNRNLPPAPWTADEDDGQQITVPHPAQALTRFPRDPRSPNERLRLEAMHEQQPGYGSDGSETISIHSAQSMPARQPTRRIANGESEQVSMNQQMDDNVEEYIEEGAISDSVMAKGSVTTATKDRKKSLMTRLIPGRNAPLEGKRTGFQRSEEVGVPEGLTVPGDYLQAPFTKQTSKESTDSSHSDNWGPILTDGPLGSFVDSLGPGQVVGRQVLASPVLGEIQIGIAAGRVGIDVEIIRAKNLVVKPGVKVNPAPYVKVYLLEGKQCIAKAKTRAVRRTTAPIFQQHIVFSETSRKKMLQITVMADYGRMERKSFMGIAQIRLDDLELSAEPVVGWYKLYHSSSLAGTGPVRKDSDTSLTEIKQ
ncbi:C2 domain family protein [Acanthocheilonema viteae]